MIKLANNGVPGWVQGVSKWMYKLQDTPFATPYVGSGISGMTEYTPGTGIMPVKVGQYLLITAVDGDGKTLAYTTEVISYEQIKQPQASELKSSSEVTSTENYNYSVPELGQVGGTTRITSLNTMGVQGAVKWMYKISGPAATTPAIPEYNSIISGLLPYVAGDSIKVTDGQCFTLYAVDNSNRIKAYKNIIIICSTDKNTCSYITTITDKLCTSYTRKHSGQNVLYPHFLLLGLQAQTLVGNGSMWLVIRYLMRRQEMLV